MMNTETNYDILIQSEDKIFKEFQEFAEHSLLVHKQLWKILFKAERSESDYETMESLDEEANFMQKNTLDDSIWAISKNQPRANHLRYIIALIYSLKDVERLSDTAFEIFKTTKYTKNYNFTHFKEIVNLYLDVLTKMKPLVGTNYKDNVEKMRALKSRFDERFYESVNKITHNLKHEGFSSKMIYQCGTICKNISLSINYYYNAFANFKYIKSVSQKTKKINLGKD